MHPRQTIERQATKRSDQAAGFRLTDPHFDFDPGLAEKIDSPTIDVRSWVLRSDDHATNSRSDHSGSTGRRLPLMGAGFQGAVQSGSPSQASCCGEGMDFGMRTPKTLVPAFADQVQVLIDYHRSDGWVRLDHSNPALGQQDGVTHDRNRRVE